MKRPVLLLPILTLFCFNAVFPSSARRKEQNSTPRFIRPSTASILRERVPTRNILTHSLRAAALDTFVLAEFTFNNEGLPDEQGWFGVDASAQTDTFVHVADTTELNGGDFGLLLPLEGKQSLWFGAAPDSEGELCSYQGLPGYGDSWDQRFTSVAFPRNGDVTISYKIRWDSEPYYDRTEVQYRNHNDRWESILVNPPYKAYYDGQGSSIEEYVIPGDSLADSLTIRFRFSSDGAWSDQGNTYPSDGASLIDSVRLADVDGEIDYQDFENAAAGSHRTADGHWQGSVPPSYGDFSGLFSGNEMLQEDFCKYDGSWFWGFFSGSTVDYTCGGHPEQIAVPYGREIDDGYYVSTAYLENEIWSPYIEWTKDAHDAPVPASASSAFLEFDAYHDLPLDNLVFYYWDIREVFDECPGSWHYGILLHYGEKKEWYRNVYQVGHLIPAGANRVQIALGAIDVCRFYCGVYGSGDCHSHAPLLDNVRVIRVDTKGPLWEFEPNRLFQDNFAEDGTTTGTVRMDMGVWGSRAYYDTMAVNVYSNIGVDHHNHGDDGSGPAVYCHVKDVSPAKSGNAVSGDPVRWPVVSTGGGWTVLRFNYLWTTGQFLKADYYCIDLNDSLYTPGDTVWYYFSARDLDGNTNYWSRQTGVTLSENEVRNHPMEVTCLPANAMNGATDILYVDDCDFRPAVEPYFETAFDMLGLTPDRFDVLIHSYGGGNGLAGRVQNVAQQIIGPYRKIIWSSGDLESQLIGDGTGGIPISNDFGLLYRFLDESPNRPGLYITGNNVAEEWVTLSGGDAVNLRNTYMNFGLTNGDHVSSGQPLTPLVIGETGSCFDHPSGPDSMLAYGGCSPIADFDVLQPSGGSALAMAYSGSPASGAVLTQVTPNAAGDTAKVMLSGFSFDAIRDDVRKHLPDRIEHLLAIIRWLENDVGDPTGVQEPTELCNGLTQNYPNPFNPVTTMRYSIRREGIVRLKVYNVAGRLVRTLVDGMHHPRAEGFTIEWDGRDDSGRPVASGVYFYKLIAEGFNQTRKMVLIR